MKSTKEENGIAMEIFGTLKRAIFIQRIIIAILIGIITMQSFLPRL